MQAFSRLLAIGFGLPTVAFLVLGFYLDNQIWAYFAIPFAILLAIVLSLSPQIDWWYYTKYPPNLDGDAVKMLEKHFDFYNGLSSNEKKRFRDRIGLYQMGVEFIGMGFDDEVPADIKLIIAAEAVRLSFGKPVFVNEAFEKYAIYPHPFPSPINTKHHPSETNNEDGLIILSAPHLGHAFHKPDQFFNIALHELAGVYIFQNKFSLAELDEQIWPVLEQISGFPNHLLQELMVFPLSKSYLQVAINYFITFPEKFRDKLPELYQVLSNELNLNPLMEHQPTMGYHK